MMNFLLWTLTLALGIFVGQNLSVAQSTTSDTFRVEGERWFVKPGALDSYDSKLADKDLKVTSESGRIGYAQPAWIGKSPGDIGRLWVIEDENGITIAECERDFSDDVLRCTSATGEPNAEDVE